MTMSNLTEQGEQGGRKAESAREAKKAWEGTEGYSHGAVRVVTGLWSLHKRNPTTFIVGEAAVRLPGALLELGAESGEFVQRSAEKSREVTPRVINQDRAKLRKINRQIAKKNKRLESVKKALTDKCGC